MNKGNRGCIERAHLRKAKRSQQKLLDKFLEYPEVSLIDIGQKTDKKGQKQIVLRIHLNEIWDNTPEKKRLTFPGKVDEFPIELVRGAINNEKAPKTLCLSIYQLKEPLSHE